MINITRHKQKQQFFDIVADKGSIGVGKNLNGTFIRNEYLYGLEEHPNAPQQVGERRYTYSASGNPLTIEGGDVNRTLTWDAENRLRRIYDSRSGQLHLYTYNHLGERALKRYGKAQAMAVNDKDAGALLDTNDNYSAYVSPYFVGHNNRYTKHYYAGAMRIASKMGASGSTYAAGTDEPDLYFYHTDHLGSTTYITDRKEVAQYVAYTPYGETFKEYRNVTPYKFNGKELDQETGYYYYGARYYDPSIALWLGVDPLAEKYPDVSPYVYCAGNPVKYVDPDGREITNADDWKAFGKDMYEATTAMLSVGLQLAANIEVGKSKSVGVVLNGSSIDIVGVREGKFTHSKDSPTVSQEASLGCGAISLQAKKEIRTNADGAIETKSLSADYSLVSVERTETTTYEKHLDKYNKKSTEVTAGLKPSTIGFSAGLFFRVEVSLNLSKVSEGLNKLFK